MPHRFYCPHLVETGSVTVEETEAHHIAHVLRQQAGDIVELINGNGIIAKCQIKAIRKRNVELNILEVRREQPPKISLTLATAVPKGDRFDWLVEKATELGVTRLIPMTTSRSIVDPRASKLDKLRQTVIAACKQSGRSHLLVISPVTAWSDFLQEINSNQKVYIAHPGPDSLISAQTPSNADSRPMLAAIGPEGGFTDEEVQSATTAGAEPIQLGEHILRIETAAIALAAKLLL